MELLILVKEDVFRKRPILGHRIITPIRDNKERTLMGPPVKIEPKQSDNPNEEVFRKRPMMGNRVLVPIKDNNEKKPTPEPTPEPTPMDLAMEEIRAAQKQREEQAALFEQMMGGAFRDATGRMVHGDDELQSFELHDDQKRREGLPTSFERFIGPNEDFGIPEEILEEYRNKLAFENRFSNNNPYGQNADDIVDDYYRQQGM